MRSFLISPDIDLSILEDKEAHYRTLEEQATKTTTKISGMPSGGGEDRNALLASLADAKREYFKWLEIWHNARSRVWNFVTEVATLSGPRRCILFSRYCQKRKWSEILPLVNDALKEEKRPPISERQMYVEHLKALEDCAEWINKTGKYYDIGRI